MTNRNSQDRWTTSLQQVVAMAEAVAATTAVARPWIGTHHLILAILQQDSPATRMLADARVYADEYRQIVRFWLEPKPPGEFVAEVVIELVVAEGPPFPGELPWTYGVDTEAALNRAAELTDGPIGVEHLLLALLAEESIGTSLLVRSAAVPLSDLREGALNLVSQVNTEQ